MGQMNAKSAVDIQYVISDNHMTSICAVKDDVVGRQLKMSIHLPHNIYWSLLSFSQNRALSELFKIKCANY